MIRDGCVHPGQRTLKLTVFQEWVDGLNLFFACWCKFRKLKSNFNVFWVDVVKIGCGHLVHETLKSAEWVYELNCFLKWNQLKWIDCDAINFGKTNRSTLYLWLLNAAVLRVKPMAVAGWILWNSQKTPSLTPDISLGVFLKLDH